VDLWSCSFDGGDVCNMTLGATVSAYGPSGWQLGDGSESARLGGPSRDADGERDASGYVFIDGVHLSGGSGGRRRRRAWALSPPFPPTHVMGRCLHFKVHSLLTIPTANIFAPISVQYAFDGLHLDTLSLLRVELMPNDEDSRPAREPLISAAAAAKGEADGKEAMAAEEVLLGNYANYY